MSKLIRVQLDDETKIYVEAMDDNSIHNDPMLEEAGSSEYVIDKTSEYLNKVITQVRSFSSIISESIRNISDEAEITFSVKLTSDAGIIISSIGTEASIAVKLKWKNSMSGE